mmetsp:Transcript_11005/g.33744  ORF Transcript_11005/g.33744 Transcript_11005/m.33744 type:complete len:91 (-) Transcript_11005:3-275(-)
MSSYLILGSLEMHLLFNKPLKRWQTTLHTLLRSTDRFLVDKLVKSSHDIDPTNICFVGQFTHMRCFSLRCGVANALGKCPVVTNKILKAS